MGASEIGMITPQQQNQAVGTAIDEAYKSGYYEAGGGRKSSTNFDTQMMRMLFEGDLPKTTGQINQYVTLIGYFMNLIPKIPNYDMSMYHELTRDFSDILAESHSEGMENVTLADVCEMIFRLRAIMPAGGQFKMEGLTPVSAIITTRHQSENVVKMPQQAPTPQGGTFSFLNPMNWGRR